MTASRYEIYIEAVWNKKASRAGWCAKVKDTLIKSTMTIADAVQGDASQAVLLQRATLTGLQKALRWLKADKERLPEDEAVALYINCGYVRQVLMQKTYSTWKRNNWKDLQGNDIPEVEHWQQVLKLLECFCVIPIQKSAWQRDMKTALACMELAEKECRENSPVWIMRKDGREESV